MKNFLTAMGILIFGLFMAVVVGISKPTPDKVEDILPPQLSVNVLPANPTTRAVSVSTYGIIEASHQIDLLARVSGEVTAVSPGFISGGEFPAGETFIKINPIQHQTRLAQALAGVRLAEEALASEKAQAGQARKEWRDLGSQEANDLFLRKPQVASAQAQLEAAKAELAQARYDIEQTSVRLDFNARIVDTAVNVGQYLNAGSKIATVYETNRMQVSLPLSQKQLSTLNIQWPLQQELPVIELTAQVGKFTYSLEAQARYSAATVDSRNQTVTLIADISDNNHSALPGTYVEAKITGIARDRVLSVPESAFHDKRYLLVSNSNNTLSFVEAKFLAREGDNILVEADISESQNIIIDRIPLASPGMKISPVLQKTVIVNTGE